MKRRRVGVAAAAIVAAAALGPAAPARVETRMVIRLISDNAVVSANDTPPQGPSAGDVIVTKSTLRNQVAQFGKPRGALVGRDRGKVTLLSPTTARLDGVATLPGGTIVIRGRVRGATAPVTGGTGRFAHARGTLTTRDLSGTRAVNVYTLTLP